MNEERLQKIIDEISDNGTRIMRPHMVMKAMKQAVNEVLDEAAENGTLLDPAMNIKCKSGHGFVVDKQSILKLKVK